MQPQRLGRLPARGGRGGGILSRLVGEVQVVSERLLDATAIAERLGVPKTWVLESARSDAIPHVRLGRYVRFDLADVEKWLNECKRPGRPIALRRNGGRGR